MNIELESIINDIYDYRIEAAYAKTMQLIEVFMKNINIESGFNISAFNRVLNYLVISFENKDYILFADILKYEILPFLENKSGDD